MHPNNFDCFDCHWFYAVCQVFVVIVVDMSDYFIAHCTKHAKKYESTGTDIVRVVERIERQMD